jgi:hypothetical protein
MAKVPFAHHHDMAEAFASDRCRPSPPVQIDDLIVCRQHDTVEW